VSGGVPLARPVYLRGMRRTFRLLRLAVEYEFRKVAVFRVGFLVREVLRGIWHPVIMVCVYVAIYRSSGVETIRGWTFDEIVSYLILVATFHKLVFHERVLDLGTQIFEGYFTKYLVMPFRFFILPLGRWVQFTLMQTVLAGLFWAAGSLAIPEIWPSPASFVAVLQAASLVLLGSFCYLELYFILNALAFWLDIVWTLLVMSRFVTGFIAGMLIPVSQMPPVCGQIFFWLFPYWTVSAPIEIFLGRIGTPEYRNGLLVLTGSLIVLETIRRLVWKRGTRQYTGTGM
jgi:ABC-2 type transport system permease protein